MSNLFSALESASSALRAFQQGLDVTQNNVSNAQTAGYAKQIQRFQALPFDSARGLSGGVMASSLEDSRSVYAEEAVRQQQSLLGSSSQLTTSLNPIEQVLTVTGAGGGIANALDALFQSFSAWSVSPNDANAQSAVLNAARQAATAFQQGVNQLTKARSAVEGDLATTVASINQIAGDIERANEELRKSPTPDPAASAQLNASLQKLSELANVQTLTNSDGTVTVLLGGQVPLVTADGQVHQISLQYPSTLGSANPSAQPSAEIVDSNGADVTQKISDGRLGALLSVHNQILPHLIGGPADTGELNVLAKEVADSVNAVLTAAKGKALFQYSATSGVDTAGTIAVTSGLLPTDLTAADPGPPPVSNGVPLKLTALGASSNSNLQGMTFDQFYASSASWIGSQLTQAQTASTAQQNTLAQAQALRQQLSGVSLDEEATQLISLQRSYQAASRMMTVIDTLTQNVIDMIH